MPKPVVAKTYDGPWDSQEDEDAAYKKYAVLRAREAAIRADEDEEKKKKRKLLPFVE